MTSLPLAKVRKTGGLVKPPEAGCPFTLSCFTHRSLPSLKANEATASVRDCSTPVVDGPVPTYSTPRFGSMVGEEAMAAPAGPNSCTPALFLRVACGSSSTV